MQRFDGKDIRYPPFFENVKDSLLHSFRFVTFPIYANSDSVMTSQKPVLLIVTEAALEHPDAVILSDADEQRVNGVFRTYQNLTPWLAQEYDVRFLTPFSWPGQPRGMLSAVFNGDMPFNLPFQPSIRLVWPSETDLTHRIRTIAPDHVHVATEAPLGLLSLLYCKKQNIPVTVSHHTKWQDYVEKPEYGVPAPLRPILKASLENYLPWFYRQADGVMAASDHVKAYLTEWGVASDKIHLVGRAADPAVFHRYPDSERPIAEKYILYAGRLAPEKNVTAFCELDTAGLRKVVVGRGELEESLKADYPDVVFAGFKQGAELARYYSGAEYFASASETETIGIVFLEARACGSPVLAIDRGLHTALFKNPGLGVLRSTLQQAFDEASKQELFMDRYSIMTSGHEIGWQQQAHKFSCMVREVKRSYENIPLAL